MNKPIGERLTIVARLGSPSAFSSYVLFLLFGFCSLVYYFGELVDLAGWAALRWDFWYGVHDIQRLLFLAPIIYAGYLFGVKATMIMTLLAFGAFLPRALFISPFPDPLLRVVLFTMVATIIGYLTALARQEYRRCLRAEMLLTRERDAVLAMLKRITDRAFIAGADYRVRFINPSMLGDFGDGVGFYCYEYLHKSNAPCRQICRLPSVINGADENWECTLPDGRTYQVEASPFIDSDKTTCQLAILRPAPRRDGKSHLG